MFNRNLVFGAACLGMLLFGIVFLSLGSVVNLLQAKFHLDNNGIGTLTALLPLGILAGSLIFGPVVDRYGYKALLIVCALMVMIGLEGIARASTIGLVQACIVLIGLGGGVLNGATNALAADVSEGERSAKLSLLGVFFGIGALGMPGILSILSEHCSQEAIVSGVGFLVIVPVIYFCVIRFPAPKQSQGHQGGAVLAMLREPWLWLLGLVLFFQSGLEGSTNDWSPRFFKSHLESGDKIALHVLTIYVAAMTATRLLLGLVLKRASSEAVLLASIGCGLVGAALLALAPAVPLATGGMILLGVGYAACFPIVLSYIADRYANASGTAFSIAFVFALVGNMIINKTVGGVTQAYGLHQFPKVLLLCLVAISLLIAGVLRQRRPAAAPVSTQNL